MSERVQNKKGGAFKPGNYDRFNQKIAKSIEHDPDQINQMLWKRKQYKKRIQKNENKKFKKDYIREKEKIQNEGEGIIAPTEEAREALQMDPKKQEFYRMLFMQDAAADSSNQNQQGSDSQGKRVRKRKRDYANQGDNKEDN